MKSDAGEVPDPEAQTRVIQRDTSEKRGEHDGLEQCCIRRTAGSDLENAEPDRDSILATLCNSRLTRDESEAESPQKMQSAKSAYQYWEEKLCDEVVARNCLARNIDIVCR